MSNEKNNEKKRKRKRPKLYKKDETEKDDDVLKKLRDVRKNLQESIDEEDKPEKSRTIKRKRGARKLYKKDEEKEIEITRKYKRKTDKEVSQKRLARVQKRVKEKVEEAKGLSKKKKAAIIIWMVIMSAPLFFITTISVMGLEMNFTNFGLVYNEDRGPGNIMISFPARNPSFLPAQLGSFEIELHDDKGEYIGKAYNDAPVDIQPYQTKTIFLTLKLEEKPGGKWLSNLLTDLKLNLNIHSLTYNGMQVNTESLPPIELDIEPLIRDAITGMLDIEDLLEGLSLEDMLASNPGQPKTMMNDKTIKNEKIELDPYTNAKRRSLLPRLSQSGEDIGTSQSGEDTGTINASFAMSENKSQFNLGLGAIIDMYDLVKPEDLGGLVLGPINISNLDAQLMVNTEKQYDDVRSIQEDDNWADNYETPIAKLISTKTNELFIGDQNRRNSVFGMNLTILKDEIGDADVHPSANISWDENKKDNSLQNFLRGEGAFEEQGEAYQDYPGWYFLYNLLHLGKLDCGLKIANLDINIFGLDMEDVSIPMDVLPPLVTEEGVLDPDNLLKVAPDYGLMGMLKHFVTGMTEGPSNAMLGVPSPSSGDLDNPESIDTLLDDFIDMVEFPDFTLDDIEESWGSNANLSLSLPITLNNTMLDFYCGFKGMKLGLATEINNVRKTFMTLGMKGSDGDTVYIPGIDKEKPVNINIEMNIYKNETLQPFAAEFLRSLISNFTLDAIIVASFDELMLFQENYTWGRFDAALPIERDIEPLLMGLVEELVPGLVGGLVGGLTDTDGDDNSTQTSLSYSPITMFLGTSPLPTLFTALSGSPILQQYPVTSQEEEEEEEEGDDPISDLLNGLINDLVGSLFGDLLGSEMEFDLGLDVEVDQATSTTFTISLNDFYIEELFISLGMGKTDLRLQSKYENKWEDIIGIQIDDYFDVKGGKRDDIELSITIYETNALCTFLDKFMYQFFENKSVTNTVDLRSTGYTTLNLSGIYMPDLEIDFKMEDFDLGLNGTELIDGMDEMIYDIELDAETGEPEPIELWAGTSSFMPQVSQGIKIDELFNLGDISIEEISENNFNQTDGTGTVRLSAEVTNHMMSLDIEDFAFTIYNEPPESENGEINEDAEKLITLEIDDGSGLSHGIGGSVDIILTIHKSKETEQWINNLLSNLMPGGYLNISASLDIFGCNINLKSGYLPTLNLSMLPIDITTLLGSITPFSGPFMDLMGPQVAQDIDTDSIFENVMKFSIGGISIGDFNGDVGALNYDDPMIDVGLDLWLQTMFNMSINSMNLQLLDGGLYEALHVKGGHSFEEVAREAALAEVFLRHPTHFNSTIPGTLDNDPDKPYVYNESACTRGENETQWDLHSEDTIFELDNSSLPDGRGDYVNASEFNSTGFDKNETLMLQKPTLNNLGLKVNLYNKSHGTWATRYKRKYWKDLGGPYFPPLKYDGYPDHYYKYHDYYSPIVSLLDKAVGILDPEAGDDVLTDLIKGIAIGGEINVTMFSMDININLNNPKLNDLFEPVSGLLMGSTGLAMKEYLREATFPMQSWQAPKEKAISRLMASQGLDDIFGDMLDFDSIPLDIKQIVAGVTFPGIPDRTDHAYSPQTVNQQGNSVCWDGHDKSDPVDYQAEYTRNPDRINTINGLPGYEGSLDDPYFTGEDISDHEQYAWRDGENFTEKEQFVKDDGYEWFKTVVDKWAQSRNRENPFFETNYTVGNQYNQDYMGGERIEDPKKWPLKYDYDAFGGRCRSNVLNLLTTPLLEIPVGFLSAKLSLWMEDPSKACQYMPFGYTWINSTVMFPEVEEILFENQQVNDSYDELIGLLDVDNPPSLKQVRDNYTETGYLAYKEEDGRYVVDQERTDIAVLGIAMCGIEGDTEGNYEPNENGDMPPNGWVTNFNVRMFEGLGTNEFFRELISTGDFNIHFLAQGFINVSVFGYELYDLYLPYDLIEIGDPSRFQRACDDYLAAEGEGGHPAYGVPGVNGTVDDTDTVEEDTEFWPHYLLEGEAMDFQLSLPLDLILDPIMGLMDDLTGILEDLDGIYLDGGYLVIDVTTSIMNPIPLSIWIEDVLIEIWLGNGDGTVDGTDWHTKLEIEDRQNVPLMKNIPDDPFEFDYNSFADWSTPHNVSLSVSATVPLGWDLISTLLSGGYIYIKDIGIRTVVPNTLGNHPELIYPMDPDDAISEFSLL